MTHFDPEAMVQFRASTEQLLRDVMAYVDAVANGTVPSDIQRRIGFPWSPAMVERSRRSVGASTGARCAAGGRPPPRP